jgi:hypothetical protein
VASLGLQQEKFENHLSSQPGIVDISIVLHVSSVECVAVYKQCKLQVLCM